MTSDFDSSNPRIAVISCIFGRLFRRLHSAPQQYDCHFYSNNPRLEPQARRKGWRFHYVAVPLSKDFAVSSFQAKYVKYLQMRKASEHRYLDQYDEVLYVDHKGMIEDQHVRMFLNLKEQPILIRKTPRLKTTVWDEVKQAELEERYSRYMKKTMEYIHARLANGCSEQIRVCNTGLICYSMRNSAVLELADEVYSDLCKVGTPECQIIWCMASQRYSYLIQQIEFDRIPLPWREPPRLTDALPWGLRHPLATLSKFCDRWKAESSRPGLGRP